MLDAGTVVPGWARTGVALNAWATRRRRCRPRCRSAASSARRDVGPNSHFYTADADECATVKAESGLDVRGDRVPHRSAAACGDRAAPAPTPVYRSFYPGATSASRTTASCPTSRCTRRWRAARPRRRRDVRAAVVARRSRGRRRAPARAGDVRPERRAGRARRRRSASPASSTSSSRRRVDATPSIKYVPAGGAGDVLPAPIPIRTCARDYYSLFQLQNEFFRNALAGDDQLRQRVAFALSQILVTSGLDINEAYGDGDLPADLPRPRVRQLRGPADQGDAVVGDGRLPQHGQQRQARATGVKPNENYARELLQLFSIGAVGAEARRHAAARRARASPIPTYDQDDDRGLRARVHRLDLSAAAGRRAAHAQPEELPRRHGRRSRPITTPAPRRCSTARSRPRACRWTPTSPTRSATSSCIRTSARSSASS